MSSSTAVGAATGHMHDGGGFTTAKIQFLPERRPAGQTKYNLFRLLALASDGIFSFSRAPLRIATYFGLLAVAIGLGHSVWLIVQLALGWAGTPLAWSYLIIATHFLGGAILCCLGILGEYVGRIFEQVKDRPVYLLKEQSAEAGGLVALPPKRSPNCPGIVVAVTKVIGASVPLR